MSLTSEEQELLDRLRKKEEAADTGAVIRLLPGGKQDDTPLVQKLRDLLKQAENGELEEFVFVGLKPRANLASPAQDATIAWAGSLSFGMLGALAKAHHVLLK